MIVGAIKAELTITLIWFEVAVAGTLELSFTVSLKLHVPVAVDVTVEKV
jgi:hypothetical protein